MDVGAIHKHLVGLGYDVATVREKPRGNVDVVLNSGDQAAALTAARAYVPSRRQKLTLLEALILRLDGADADAQAIITAEAARIKSRLGQ